ncbi:GNAT family N-acetyltransferase [Actinophytocola glycyrrhizae]|uniref:GNAT family N-acetyltransferase n=1 Tax=Actinophytocola glycyrrhizae TaxID=2044873 RepID=A0ABV9S763_9PSEU
MGDLHIRRARPADLETLVQELGQRRFFEDRFSRQSRKLGMLLTAWRAGVPIGVLYLWLEDAEEKELRDHLPGTPILNHLEIHPDHRGGGVGSTLIDEAERRLRKLLLGQVALAVEDSNERAARLYKRLGYEEWPHSPIRCYSLTDGDGVRQVEICQIMVKALLREM